MAQDFGTGKTLVVLAIVLGCFAILWPKIFYPMMQTAFAMTSPKTDSDGRLIRDNERPPHLHPSSSGSVSTGAGNVRRGPIAEDVADKFLMREGRPFPQPQARNPVKPTPKSGGAMSIIMPIYTVGIVVFFLYTVLKLVFKKQNEGDNNNKKPLIKDFHMDQDYHKFVLQTPIAESTTTGIIRKEKGPKKKSNRPKIRTPKFEEKIEEEMDSKDYEIFKLKKKLEDTEHAMERIMNHMGSVSACLSDKMKLEKKLADSQDSGVRQRHKKAGRKTPESSQTSKKCYIEEVPDDNSVSTLEEDLSELISMCKATDDSLKNKDDSSDEKMDNSAEKEEESFESEEISSNDDEDSAQAIALQNKRYPGENAIGQKGVCS